MESLRSAYLRHLEQQQQQHFQNYPQQQAQQQQQQQQQHHQYQQLAASLHGLDMQISHELQHTWDNFLPSGVYRPTTFTHSETLPSYQIFPTNPWTVTSVHAAPHPFFTSNPWMTTPAQVCSHQMFVPAQVSSHPMVTEDPSITIPTHMTWPRKEKAEAIEKKMPVIKTTTMKVGVVQARNRLRWCSVCRRDCITEAALKQHFDGKKHKKQVERQRVIAEEEAKNMAMMDEGAMTTAIEQMWMHVSMMGKCAKPKKKKANKAKKGLRVLAALPPRDLEAAVANAVVADIDATPGGGNARCAVANAAPMDVIATPGDTNITTVGDGNAVCAVSNVVPTDVNVTPGNRNGAPEGDENATTHASANTAPMDVNTMPGDVCATPCDQNAISGDGNATAGDGNSVPIEVNVTPVDGNCTAEVDGNATHGVSNDVCGDLNAILGNENVIPEGERNATWAVGKAVPVDANSTLPEGDRDATWAVANDVPMDANVTSGVLPQGPNLSPSAVLNIWNLSAELGSGTKREAACFRCELCNVACNTQAMLEIHFGGKKHMKKLKKLQVPPASEHMGL